MTRRRAPFPWIVALLCLNAACSDLTHVSAPDLVQPADLDNAAGAQERRGGAVADFAYATSYQALVSGIFSDEMIDKSGIYLFDRRIVTSVGNPGPFSNLSKARIDALQAIRGLEQYSPTPDWHIAEMFAYLGFAETMFAEDLCSGVPLGDVVNGQPVYGAALTRSALIARALVDFDSAATHSAGFDSVADMARVGKARALLDSGDVAAAAVLVASVPVADAYALPYSSTLTTQWNTLDLAYASIGESVADHEGINGLDFRSADDPRVGTYQVGVSSDGTTPLFGMTKYSSIDAPLLLATGVEAALISAEALLRSDTSGAAWIGALNALRADSMATGVGGLAPLANPATYHDRVDLMFRERAFWLFATGHRQGDLRRLIRQYGRPTESVFPTGLYEGGPARYGTEVVFQPEQTENANPNYHGCIDRLP